MPCAGKQTSAPAESLHGRGPRQITSAGEKCDSWASPERKLTRTTEILPLQRIYPVPNQYKTWSNLGLSRHPHETWSNLGWSASRLYSACYTSLFPVMTSVHSITRHTTRTILVFNAHVCDMAVGMRHDGPPHVMTYPLSRFGIRSHHREFGAG